MANNEFSNAAPLRTLSMKDWDQVGRGCCAVLVVLQAQRYQNEAKGATSHMPASSSCIISAVLGGVAVLCCLLPASQAQLSEDSLAHSCLCVCAPQALMIRAVCYADSAHRRVLAEGYRLQLWVSCCQLGLCRNLTVAVLLWLQDDAFEHQGAHVFLPGGNLRLLEALAKDMPIMYNTAARTLQYCSTGVCSTCVWGWGMAIGRSALHTSHANGV